MFLQVASPLFPLSVLMIGFYFCLYVSYKTARDYRLLKAKKWGGKISRYGFKKVRSQILQMVVMVPFYVNAVYRGILAVVNLING